VVKSLALSPNNIQHLYELTSKIEPSGYMIKHIGIIIFNIIFCGVQAIFWLVKFFINFTKFGRLFRMLPINMDHY
jgi:hypothetical protein